MGVGLLPPAEETAAKSDAAVAPAPANQELYGQELQSWLTDTGETNDASGCLRVTPS